MKGFALIEVLVALLILSLGLLGIAGMQLAALQHSQEAYWRSLAATQLSSFFESLSVNRTDAARKKEQDRWKDLSALLLPKGDMSYICDKESICTVTVGWKTKQDNHITMTGAP